VLTIVDIGDAGAVDAAVEALRAGGAVVVPTDTVYGVASLPSEVDQLYALKGRPAHVPSAVLVASVEQASEVVDLSPTAVRVAAVLWPGPLTIVSARRDRTGRLGVRWPDHAFVVEIARRTGPLTVTSANRHGRPTPPSAVEAAAGLSGDIALVIDGGDCVGDASTVVDLSASEPVIVRAGPITPEQIRAAALR